MSWYIAAQINTSRRLRSYVRRLGCGTFPGIPTLAMRCDKNSNTGVVMGATHPMRWHSCAVLTQPRNGDDRDQNEDGHDQRQHDADHEAGDDRQVDRGLASPPDDIARQPSERHPGHHHEPETRDDDAEDDEIAAHD